MNDIELTWDLVLRMHFCHEMKLPTLMETTWVLVCLEIEIMKPKQALQVFIDLLISFWFFFVFDRITQARPVIYTNFIQLVDKVQESFNVLPVELKKKKPVEKISDTKNIAAILSAKLLSLFFLNFTNRGLISALVLKVIREI